MESVEENKLRLQQKYREVLGTIQKMEAHELHEVMRKLQDGNIPLVDILSAIPKSPYTATPRLKLVYGEIPAASNPASPTHLKLTKKGEST
jgi:hypothetical protein